MFKYVKMLEQKFFSTTSKYIFTSCLSGFHQNSSNKSTLKTLSFQGAVKLIYIVKIKHDKHILTINYYKYTRHKIKLQSQKEVYFQFLPNTLRSHGGSPTMSSNSTSQLL